MHFNRFSSQYDSLECYRKRISNTPIITWESRDESDSNHSTPGQQKTVACMNKNSQKQEPRTPLTTATLLYKSARIPCSTRLHKHTETESSEQKTNALSKNQPDEETNDGGPQMSRPHLFTTLCSNKIPALEERSFPASRLFFYPKQSAQYKCTTISAR